jgi:hypothetical protein
MNAVPHEEYNTHKLHEMKLEQAVLPNPCLEEEKSSAICAVSVLKVKLSLFLTKYHTMKTYLVLS